MVEVEVEGSHHIIKDCTDFVASTAPNKDPLDDIIALFKLLILIEKIFNTSKYFSNESILL